jgi:hypothetical protein
VELSHLPARGASNHRPTVDVEKITRNQCRDQTWRNGRFWTPYLILSAGV